MSSGSLSCTICSEIYKNSDEIYSTTCGHIFHLVCMREWQSRSATCPKCREHNPQSHKIFLDFDEPTDTDKKILELKAQLEQGILSSSELQHQLDQSERNLLEMQLALSNGEATSEELNEQIRYLTIQNDYQKSKEDELNFQLDQIERNLLETQLQLSEGEETTKELSEKISYLTIQNESHKSQEIELQNQLEQIKRNLLESQLELSKGEEKSKEPNEKINDLTCQSERLNAEIQFLTKLNENKTDELKHQLEQAEQKLLQIQLELSESRETAKELNEKISCLTIQNENRELKEKNGIKTEVHGEEVKLREKVKVLEARLKQISIELENEIKNSTGLMVDKMKLQGLLQHCPAVPVTMPTTLGCPKSTIEPIRGNTAVFIAGLSVNALVRPLELIVLKLAEVMGLQFTKDDIESVFKSGKKYPSMVVKFKDLDHKIKFLSNKQILKNKPETAQIKIHEYVTDTNFNTLFDYAKTLKNIGYKFIYWQNYAVFVRKTKNTAPIKIANKSQVDEMLKTANDAKEGLVSLAAVPEGGIFDECFYDDTTLLDFTLN